ncbi:S-adenosyl-L-methionine-dependent methyltransferase [Chaetomidium leptoderma]|uniref:tRNA wybutosine-synthesizing protein 2 n=1 Tax=Chaetomidium leptoderma TaxID=669021 RepID=A0AAN6ZWN3_9PEZI|nr:S-adenosyl-L-methionine-dependent methyltransferase [Chaetomidium leptoderma]
MARPPKPKQNPIQNAVRSWLDSLPPALVDSLTEQFNTDTDTTSHNDIKQVLLDRAPKRWVVYEPMVLLPSGSFASPPWPALLSSSTPSQTEPLWTAILAQLSPTNSKPPLTHLAINEGIPLHLSQPSSPPLLPSTEKEEDEKENLLRSPSHLHPLHGPFFFNPSSSSSSTSQQQPPDFNASLWVTTKQNNLIQTWSPQHTMFSRGNIKEKARLLSSFGHHHHPSQKRVAIDLYAGIGYFTFSFAKLGMRVLCWELNPWSVEGLRRGAEANGFSIRVVVAVTPPGVVDVDMKEVLAGGEQIVVFLEDNRFAARRVAEMEDSRVVHVNCGFLPSSEGVWRDAFGMVGGGRGWLHLHENVGAGDIEARKAVVQRLFDGWAKEEEEDDGETGATVKHVELVKTFAPGVWHCVFDVLITRSSAVA